MPDFATIQVHKETKQQVASLRRQGETYDMVLKRLLDHAIREEEDAFLRELNEDLEKGDFVPLDDVWPSS